MGAYPLYAQKTQTWEFQSTLDRFNFTEHFENSVCIIRKSVMKTTGSVGEKKD